MKQDQRVLRKGGLRFQPVDLRDADGAAAHRFPPQTDPVVFGAGLDDHRIGVIAGVLPGDDLIGKPPELRQPKALPDLFVVGGKAQQAADDGLIRAVAPIGIGKGAVKGHLRPAHILSQQLAADQPDPDGPRRMGGGRPHRNGAQNIK